MSRILPLVFLTILVARTPVATACDARTLAVPASTTAAVSYAVSWDGAVTAASLFELQTATDAAFTAPSTSFVTGASSATIPASPGNEGDERRFYRVREICEGTPGAWSVVATSIIDARPAAERLAFSFTIPETANGTVVQNFLVPGFGESATNDDRFAIALQPDWISVFPQQGALSAGGTTIQFTIDPAKLPAGRSKTEAVVTRSQVGLLDSLSVPLAVEVVPPVREVLRTSPPPQGTLLIPAVAHADGDNSRFETDVRITNPQSTPVSLDVTYSLTGVNGTRGRTATITLAPDETRAFDDVVRTAFGSGILGEFGLGTVEIRPVTPGDRVLGASRTFNTTPNGTLGQFIPALPVATFVGATAPERAVISLQQIAWSDRYRTNLGFVEGIGAPVDLTVRLFDANDALLAIVPLHLDAFGHRQLSLSAPELFPQRTFADGRVEVEVASGAGRASAYASVLDNQTSDPLLVYPVVADHIAATRFALPGIAELKGSRNFHSDMRIFNAADDAVTVTLAYRPQTGDATAIPEPVAVTLAAREMRVIDDVLPSLWQLDGTGGAVVATTTSPSSLVLTARTYSRNATDGTYGQFIQAVTPDEATGAGEAPLHVLQLEQSTNFRSNLGLMEVTGTDSVSIEITAWAGTATTPVSTEMLTLAAGEFRQIGSYFATRGVPDAFNGRVSIRVVAGGGRVTAYGSVIDARTEDPTFVPAQR